MAVGAGENMVSMGFIFLKKGLTGGCFFSNYPLNGLNHHSLSILKKIFPSHQE